MTDAPKQQHGFRKGQSGNPAGRPRGSKNKVLLALDMIGAEAAEGVLNKAVEAAKGGDIRAAELILSRCWPARKGRTVAFPLPPVQSAADVLAAVSAVVAAVAAGDLTPDEGQQLAAVLEASRKTIELADVERRLAALEAQQEENAS